MIKLFEKIETEKYIVIKILFIKITFKKKNEPPKSDIDTIVWWIPFKNLRNAVRNLLNTYMDLLNINNNPVNINNSIDIIEQIMKDNANIHIQEKHEKLLFYTCANEKYYPFAIIYPIFALAFNNDALVEIGLQDYDYFYSIYKDIIEYYKKKYNDKIYYHNVKFYDNVMPNSIRFISKPHYKTKYVYIGDIDILILEDIFNFHYNNIKHNKLDFSNHKRININYLTGLHFIEYDKMYPITIPENINIYEISDEELLYYMMVNKKYKITNITNTNRPIHGYHVSYFSRPPLRTITTKDTLAKSVPAWTIDKEIAKKYQTIRFSKEVKDIYSLIKEDMIEIRKIIQYMDLVSFYIINNHTD